ncbi:MAG: MerR family transcriptional regulator [Erysipelotrichaceae bacterium]|nr:MerR family transcriptional regulator [Erysipelotrichaceae bacterium]
MKMTIKGLSNISGLSIDTIRHYTNIGLLHPIRNEKNNYYYYRDIDLRRLMLVVNYKSFGFPLSKCKKLLDLSQVNDFETEINQIISDIEIKELFLEYSMVEATIFKNSLQIITKKVDYNIFYRESYYLYTVLFDKYDGVLNKSSTYDDQIVKKLIEYMPITRHYRKINLENFIDNTTINHELGIMIPAKLIDKLGFDKNNFIYFEEGKYIEFIVEKKDNEIFDKKLIDPYMNKVTSLGYKTGNHILSYMVMSLNSSERINFHSISFKIYD